jgi:hypothetical protein
MPRIGLTITLTRRDCCPIVDDCEKKYGGAQIQPAALRDLNEMIGRSGCSGRGVDIRDAKRVKVVNDLRDLREPKILV